MSPMRYFGFFSRLTRMASRFHITRPRQLRDFVWTLIRTDFKARYHGDLRARDAAYHPGPGELQPGI